MPPKLTRETLGLYLLYGAWAVFWLSLLTLVVFVASGQQWRWDLGATLAAFGAFGGAYMTKDVFDVQPPIQSGAGGTVGHDESDWEEAV